MDRSTDEFFQRNPQKYHIQNHKKGSFPKIFITKQRNQKRPKDANFIPFVRYDEHKNGL